MLGSGEMTASAAPTSLPTMRLQAHWPEAVFSASAIITNIKLLLLFCSFSSFNFFISKIKWGY